MMFSPQLEGHAVDSMYVTLQILTEHVQLVIHVVFVFIKINFSLNITQYVSKYVSNNNCTRQDQA